MTADPPTPRRPDSEAERLRTALQRIRTEGGRVCADFETCTHVACQSSVAAWMIADAALNGETPESANGKPRPTAPRRGSSHEQWFR